MRLIPVANRGSRKMVGERGGERNESATRGQSESNRDTSNLLRDRPMRPGRVNTYHNDPFVAAPANNAFVIALSLAILPLVRTSSVGRRCS